MVARHGYHYDRFLRKASLTNPEHSRCRKTVHNSAGDKIQNQPVNGHRNHQMPWLIQSASEETVVRAIQISKLHPLANGWAVAGQGASAAIAGQRMLKKARKIKQSLGNKDLRQVHVKACGETDFRAFRPDNEFEYLEIFLPVKTRSYRWRLIPCFGRILSRNRQNTQGVRGSHQTICRTTVMG
jgi:hypothetical protein